MRSASVESPRDLAGAIALLAEPGPAWHILAGGTDLMVELQTGRTKPTRVLDLWAVDELRGIVAESGGVRIGALETCSSLLSSELVRSKAWLLTRAALEVGAVQIQNRATLGGNLGTASPAADLNPVLIALGAKVRLVSSRGARDLPVEGFLVDYRSTARSSDELIESVYVPPRPTDERSGFRKVGTRRAQSIAKIVVALTLSMDGASVGAVRAAAGSVAPQVVQLPSLGDVLVGQAPTVELVAKAARAASELDVAPIDDVRSSASYRRLTLERVLRTLLSEALDPNPGTRGRS